MRLDIIKSYIPKCSFYGTPKELEIFIRRPQKMKAVIQTSKESVDEVLAKAPSSIMHTLNVTTWSSKDDVKITDMRIISPGKVKISFTLSQHAWEEAFGQLAADKWNKAVAARKRYEERIKIRNKAAKERRKETASQQFVDVLVKCILDKKSNKIRVKPIESRSGKIKTSYFVKFPNKLRVLNKQYIVEHMYVSNGFYVISGNIYEVAPQKTRVVSY